MQELANLRQEYTKDTLDVSTILTNPIQQFEKWFKEATQSGVVEPNAMTVSTVKPDGRPTSRVILLKGIENQKFVFFTNYQSAKGKELENNPAVALNFFWPELERQVRIEGLVNRIDAARSETYFQSRPRGSQVGAWSSPQSAVLETRSILEDRMKEIEKRFEGKDVLPKPQQWGGYEVEPLLFEFWQGRASRLHDRIQFTKEGQNWKIFRLAP